MEHLTIHNLDKKDSITCQFNPSDLSFKKSNSWKSDESGSGGKKTAPELNFAGEGLQTISLSLTFDTYESDPLLPVTTHTDKLLKLMHADVSATSKNKQGRPPHLQLQWGKTSSVRVVLTQLDHKYTLFTPDGTPVRATVQLTLQEVPDPSANKGQNPTSRAAGARRVRMVQPGDTLDWIAADELGDPGSWRLVAEANAIDDPRRLRAGQYLVIPPEA